MSTAVSDRVDVDALQAMLEDGAVCMYKRVDSYATNKQTFECDQPASWAGTCRTCGVISLLCEEHFIALNKPRPPNMMMRCGRCLTSSVRFSDLYMFVHKI